MFAIHVAQIISEKRFVYSPDSTDPHPLHIFRLVRALVVAISSTWGKYLLGLGGRLFLKQLDLATGSKRLQTSILSVSILYYLGALVDLGQCHHQAGGIGKECNGVACLKVAFSLSLAVLMFRASCFWTFSLALESAYRVNWLRRPGNGSSVLGTEVSFIVHMWIMFCSAYPFLAHFFGIARALNKKSSSDRVLPI